MREWRDDDLAQYAAMAADPEVMRFLGGVVSRAEAWRAMALHAGHWQLRGYGLWAVEGQDGSFLGRVGLWNPDGWPGLEVGWTLARQAWGTGYATETARAAMGWAWSELRAPRLISLIAVDNARSIHVADRLGMTPLRGDDLHGTPVTIYGIERPLG